MKRISIEIKSVKIIVKILSTICYKHIYIFYFFVNNENIKTEDHQCNFA